MIIPGIARYVMKMHNRKTHKALDILFFCPRWGADAVDWETFLDQVVDAGYHGVEIGLPDGTAEAEMILELINRRNLLYILQHYETTAPDFENHRTEYKNRITRLASYQPYLINSHTGRDFFTAAQNRILLHDAKEIADAHGLNITHETHRSRFNFAAHVTHDFLDNDWLKLTLDISHWFCVAETMLEDQEEIVTDTIPHVAHIHARYGHTQGPQIDQLDHQKWDYIKERHLQVWDKIIAYHLQHKSQQIGITTEFGPWPYMVSASPLENGHTIQFEWNRTLMTLLKTRYKTLR